MKQKRKVITKNSETKTELESELKSEVKKLRGKVADLEKEVKGRLVALETALIQIVSEARTKERMDALVKKVVSYKKKPARKKT